MRKALLGALGVQLYIYTTSFPKDRWTIKALGAFLVRVLFDRLIEVFSFWFPLIISLPRIPAGSPPNSSNYALCLVCACIGLGKSVCIGVYHLDFGNHPTLGQCWCVNLWIEILSPCQTWNATMPVALAVQLFFAWRIFVLELPKKFAFILALIVSVGGSFCSSCLSS